MKNRTLQTALLFTLLIGLWACRDQGSASEADPRLIKCWLHSYEEQAEGGTDWYRPCDYKEFGPSHFRRRIILKENNEAEYLELSPVDAHTMRPGRWDYNEDSKTLRIMNTAGKEIWSFNVVSIEDDKLELTQH